MTSSIERRSQCSNIGTRWASGRARGVDETGMSFKISFNYKREDLFILEGFTQTPGVDHCVLVRLH